MLGRIVGGVFAAYGLLWATLAGVCVVVGAPLPGWSVVFRFLRAAL